MAATTSHRAWEIGNGPSNSNTTPRGQLPSITALTNAFPSGPGSNGLPSPASTRERDSGAWSSQPQSTRKLPTHSSYRSISSLTGFRSLNIYLRKPLFMLTISYRLFSIFYQHGLSTVVEHQLLLHVANSHFKHLKFKPTGRNLPSHGVLAHSYFCWCFVITRFCSSIKSASIPKPGS